MEQYFKEARRQIKHKFNNKPVVEDGKRYASKLEFQFKNHLELLKKSGAVLFYLTQVPIHLPGKTKYIVDFMVFFSNSEVKFIDTKGVETPTFRLKKRQVEELYPFEIEIVKKGQFK